MARLASGTTHEQHSVLWPLQWFGITNDFKSPGPALLMLDRANSEFGLLYEIGNGKAAMAQFPDTDEPVFFQVSRARAACSRFNASCKKVCVLMPHFQLDLQFTKSAHASDFLQMLGRLATKVGNVYFEVYEGPS